MKRACHSDLPALAAGSVHPAPSWPPRARSSKGRMVHAAGRAHTAGRGRRWGGRTSTTHWRGKCRSRPGGRNMLVPSPILFRIRTRITAVVTRTFLLPQTTLHPGFG